mmetsp:Transcript_26597/g.36644  ORF Transcript_26597/g.36644 Transcript_26597/m.36644 type:complete len:267 (+) Transcript_26597:38-838(+)|eukprot:CAMPEP_0201099556 /NCGR_PEP_ID=MMETSP0812-20130820/8498_1 /ASSEMBLY_ACC=CAM_ASM_000668 /TAXON_ID=98059 /ORGANISM="Dinobryon sp., Strain UTEXLB2267" /LENGTH=266 /DNA_ID=CAMNT_0047355481 /DNA_START=38 /DNA_END=841 /DNA_ORIENTATION=-
MSSVENAEVDSEVEDVRNILSKLDMVAVNSAKDIYEYIMQPFPIGLGKAVSKKERDELNLKDSTLVYGEITFDMLGTVLEKIKKVYGRPNVGASGVSGIIQNKGGIFYDLGAGTGKPVIAAAVYHNFDVCYGIELLEGLYSVSLDALNAYNTRGKAKLNRETDTHCQMIQGSFLKLSTKDWRDADIVFANSTCYDEVLMSSMAKIAGGMRKGSFFITLTKRLPSSDFAVLEYEMYKMSWGEATVFVMQKTTDPKQSLTGDDSDDDA